MGAARQITRGAHISINPVIAITHLLPRWADVRKCFFGHKIKKFRQKLFKCGVFKKEICKFFRI